MDIIKRIRSLYFCVKRIFGSHSKVPKQRGLTAKKSHRKEIPLHRRVTAKRSHFFFRGKSRTKAPSSHLQYAFWGKPCTKYVFETCSRCANIVFFAAQKVPLKMDEVTPPEGHLRTFPVGMRKFCFLCFFLRSLELEIACGFLWYSCNRACRGRRIHLNSQGLCAILFVEVDESMWIPRVSVSWDELRRHEKSPEDMRRCEMRREEMRWADTSCQELRQVEKSGENLR